MTKKTQCDVFAQQLAALDTEPCGELLQHINTCPHCKAEYEKYLKMSSMIKNSVPPTPDIKSSVMAKIKAENISISPKPAQRSRRVSVFAIAAAAAMLTALASMYGTQKSSPLNEADSAVLGAMPLQLSLPETEAELMMMPTQGYDGATENGTSNDEGFYESTTFSTTTDDAKDAAPEYEEQAESAAPLQDATKNSKDKSINDYGDHDARLKTESASPEEPAAMQEISDHDAIAETEEDTVEEFVEETEAEIEAETEAEVEEDAIEEYVSITEPVQKPDGVQSVGGGANSASEVYAAMEQSYPGRISAELFESVGYDVYLAFVNSLQDPENGYTEQALIDFAKEYK